MEEEINGFNLEKLNGFNLEKYVDLEESNPQQPHSHSHPPALHWGSETEINW